MTTNTVQAATTDINQSGYFLLAANDTQPLTEGFVSTTKDGSRSDSGSDPGPDQRITPGRDSSEQEKNRRRSIPSAKKLQSKPSLDSQLPAAVVWYKEKAESGDKLAQYNLAAVYESGFGVNVDMAEASKWYLKAAEQGQVLAQLRIGVLYILGKGVRESSIKGAKWIRSAAKNGNELANMLDDKVISYEKETDIDVKHVVSEVHKALAKGDIYAQEKLIKVLAKLKQEKKNLPKKERFAGKVTGSGAKPGSVSNNIPGFLDKNAEIKLIEASDFASISRQAREGDAESQYLLGRLYELGQSVEQDKAEAVKWYSNSALQKNREAQYRLGVAKIYGLGTEVDIVKGGEWLHKAAVQKHEVAKQLISFFTSSSSGVVNYSSSVAFSWQLERAFAGNGEAQLAVGHMLENGWGIGRDTSAARQWYAKSRATGIKGAGVRLRQMKIAEFDSSETSSSNQAATNQTTQPIFQPTIQPQVQVKTTTAAPSAKPTIPAISGSTPSNNPPNDSFEIFGFELDLDFDFGLPKDIDLKSLMVPIGLILIGLVLGMIVFRWMDGMLHGKQQQSPQNQNSVF